MEPRSLAFPSPNNPTDRTGVADCVSSASSFNDRARRSIDDHVSPICDRSLQKIAVSRGGPGTPGNLAVIGATAAARSSECGSSAVRLQLRMHRVIIEFLKRLGCDTGDDDNEERGFSIGIIHRPSYNFRHFLALITPVLILYVIYGKAIKCTRRLIFMTILVIFARFSNFFYSTRIISRE